MSKKTAVKEPMNRTALYNEIATQTGLTKKQVASVMDALADVIERHIKKNAAGIFTLPGLLKIKTVSKPAQPAKKGVPNPFKPGELMDIPAKPASRKVKVLPLKKVKDMAAS